MSLLSSLFSCRVEQDGTKSRKDVNTGHSRCSYFNDRCVEELFCVEGRVCLFVFLFVYLSFYPGKLRLVLLGIGISPRVSATANENLP